LVMEHGRAGSGRPLAREQLQHEIAQSVAIHRADLRGERLVHAALHPQRKDGRCLVVVKRQEQQFLRLDPTIRRPDVGQRGEAATDARAKGRLGGAVGAPDDAGAFHQQRRPRSLFEDEGNLGLHARSGCASR
jgi:hypothetical protein